MICPRCSDLCSDDARYCPECGCFLLLTEGDFRTLREMREHRHREIVDSLIADVQGVERV